MKLNRTQPEPAWSDQETVRFDDLRDRAIRAPSDLLRVSRWELRSLIERVCRTGHGAAVVEPVTLVNEVARRLLGASGPQDLVSRSDFFAELANAFRRMLRAGRQSPFSDGDRFDLVALDLGEPVRVAALDAALRLLEGKSPMHAQLVILRLLGGMTTPEIAEQMGLSERRVSVGWLSARDWLRRWLDVGPVPTRRIG